jgi:hypothetical protein
MTKINRRIKIKRRKIINNSSNDIFVDYWNKIKGGKDFCFVCDKIFKSHHKRKYIGNHKMSGEKLYRHDFCESGSSNWISKFGGRIFNIKKQRRKIL